jgi:NOL1/NOP2/fmu family ribosome biogenesis protein
VFEELGTITKGRDHAPLNGVFLNSKFVHKAIEVMEEEAKALAEGKAVDPNKVINLTVREAEVVREVV